jgi:hypothetical protein
MCSFWLVEALTRDGQAFPEKLDLKPSCSRKTVSGRFPHPMYAVTEVTGGHVYGGR